MSAERLRQAAAKIRGTAKAASPGSWMVDPDHPHIVMRPDKPGNGWDGTAVTAIQEDDFGLTDPCDAEHIALWSPPAALAVADWLDDIATRHAPSADQLELVLHYYSDEVCETCEDGGHLSTICEGCFPTWEGNDGYSTYPCVETRRALILADLILGGAA